MFIIGLIVLQVLIFGGLILFLRHLLRRNVTQATSHLQEMIKDNSEKQEEIARKLAAAQKEHDETVVRLQKELAEMKEKARKEIEQKRDMVLEEAHRQSEDVISRAQKTSEEIQADIDRVVNERAMVQAGALLGTILPDPVRVHLHEIWMQGLMNDRFSGLERLRVPPEVDALEVATPISLTSAQEQQLIAAVRDKLGRNVTLRQAIQPELVAGIVMRLGTLVLDGSFSHNVREAVRESAE